MKVCFTHLFGNVFSLRLFLRVILTILSVLNIESATYYMRFIFLSLLLINISVAVWGVVRAKPLEGSSGAGQVYTASSAASTIALLSELEGYTPRERDVREVSAAVSDAAGSIGMSKLCTILGPFDSREESSEIIERLAAIDITSALKELELPAGSGFWVYLEPESTRAAALKKLADLQARGIDSYIVPRGSQKNAISLGMFSRKDLAQATIKEVKKMDLEPRMDVIERKYKEMWVMLKPEEVRKMSAITWQRLLEDKKNVQRRENICLDVAS